MTLQVLVIGDRPRSIEPTDELMEHVARSTVQTENFRVLRCIQPEDLSGLLSSVHQGKGVDVLDIFDHGRSGAQWLGSRILFDCRGDGSANYVGESIAKSLIPHLRGTAQVRLLGCGTSLGLEGAPATGDAGRLLLRQLARTLGGRRMVFGTIREVDEGTFDEGGFKRDAENDYLFSSHAALDVPPPAFGARVQGIKYISSLRIP